MINNNRVIYDYILNNIVDIKTINIGKHKIKVILDKTVDKNTFFIYDGFNIQNFKWNDKK